jgi:zinc transport system permease protein
MRVVPVAAAAQIAGSYRQTMAVATGIGAVSAVTGLLVSSYADATPGASTVLVAIACYVVAAVARSGVNRRQGSAEPSRTVAG